MLFWDIAEHPVKALLGGFYLNKSAFDNAPEMYQKVNQYY
jgi:hypothetical protein